MGSAAPIFTVRDVTKTVEYYQKVFGATFPSPDASGGRSAGIASAAAVAHCDPASAGSATAREPNKHSASASPRRGTASPGRVGPVACAGFTLSPFAGPRESAGAREMPGALPELIDLKTIRPCDGEHLQRVSACRLFRVRGNRPAEMGLLCQKTWMNLWRVPPASGRRTRD